MRGKKITRITTHAWHHGLRTVIVHSLPPSWNSEGKSGLKWVTSGVELQPVLSDLCRALRRRCKVIKPTGTVVCYFDDTRSFVHTERVRIFFWREGGGGESWKMENYWRFLDYSRLWIINLDWICDNTQINWYTWLFIDFFGKKIRLIQFLFFLFFVFVFQYSFTLFRSL